MLLNTSNRKEKIREREKQKARKKRQNAGGERSNIFYYKKTFFSIFVFLLTVNARNFRMKLILFLETCL